jgi:predicted nucleic acid-binding protein
MISARLPEELEQQDIARVIELTRKYKDLPMTSRRCIAAHKSFPSESGPEARMDFADCTLVIAAEKTGIRSIISIDSDFDVYRLPGKVRIENVFKEEE